MEHEQQPPAFSRRELFRQLIKPPLAEPAIPAPDVIPDTQDVDLTPYREAMARFWRQSYQMSLPSCESLLQEQIQPLEALFSQLSASHPQAPQVCGLLSQAYQLAAILTSHGNDLRQRVLYCKQAVQWAEAADDPTLLAAALAKLGLTWDHLHDPAQARAIYQRALASGPISPLVETNLLLKQAALFAQEGNERESMALLAQGRRLFPAQPQDDPAFLYADGGVASFYLWESMLHLTLGASDQQKLGAISHLYHARTVLTALGQVNVPDTPQRIRVETFTQLARTAILLDDLDGWEQSLLQGIRGARQLNSARRYAEAIACYRQAREHWPTEDRVLLLSAWFLA
jgi:tetratricopeptide (TPR) repeat protein